MNSMIAEYRQQIEMLNKLITHYHAALKDAQDRKRNIEAGRISRKIGVLKEERDDLYFAINRMTSYQEALGRGSKE